jgi:hypothetical protein
VFLNPNNDNDWLFFKNPFFLHKNSKFDAVLARHVNVRNNLCEVTEAILKLYDKTRFRVSEEKLTFSRFSDNSQSVWNHVYAEPFG